MSRADDDSITKRKNMVGANDSSLICFMSAKAGLNNCSN
jgi:hypothetical protein